MADMLGEAYVVIRASMDKVKGDATKAGAEIKSSLLQSLTGFELPEGVTPQMAAGLGAAALAAAGAYQVFNASQKEWNENIRIGEQLSEDFTKAEARRRAALDANAGMVGFSPQDVRTQAKVLSDAVSGSAAKITEAQTKLLAFHAVQGDIVKRATKDAVDLAAALGEDVPAAASLLGRALNEPERGMMQLRRAGILLTTSQQQLVRQFMATGQYAKAQEVLLSALEKQYGGFAEKSLRPLDRLKSELADVQRQIGDITKEREPLQLKAKITFAGLQLGVEEAFGDAFRTINAGIPGQANDFTTFGQFIGNRIGDAALSNIFEEFTNLKIPGLLLRLPGMGLKALEAFNADKTTKRPAAKEEMERESPQGFFTAIQLSKKLQEIALGDNQQKLIDLTAEGNQISRDGFSTIAERMKATPETLPIAKPR